jgi:adenosylcobinamide-GDP ribazoletransferase
VTQAVERVGAELRGVAAAAGFLTTAPVERLVRVERADLQRAGPAFPLVGAVVGLAVGATSTGLDGVLSPLVAAGLALAVGVLLTGGMHLDALADTADALAADSPSRALEIMRDPRVGSYGAIAVSLGLVVEAGALAAAAASAGTAAVVAVFAVSRAAAPPLLLVLPDAREGEGLVGAFGCTSRLRPTAAVVLALFVAWALVAALAAALCLAAFAVSALVGLVATRRFGGATGDMLGATILLTEVGGLVVIGAAS